MKNTCLITLKNIKMFSLVLGTLTLTSCGSFNSSEYASSDGVYGESTNVATTNSNGIYYKDYFDQKAQEYGLNTLLMIA